MAYTYPKHDPLHKQADSVVSAEEGCVTVEAYDQRWENVEISPADPSHMGKRSVLVQDQEDNWLLIWWNEEDLVESDS